MWEGLVRLREARGWRGQVGVVRRRQAAVAIFVDVAATTPAVVWADVQPVTQTGGPPQLPIPMFQETGLPDFTMPVGRPTLPSAGDPGSGGSPGGGEPGGGGGGGGTSADAVLQERSWGALASQNVSAMGVNPTAIAAACVIESGCQSVNARPGGTVSGAYQMTDSTYSADIRQALAQNPSLTGYIDTSLAGKMDPANQAIAAAQDLKNAASSLQATGITNPTFLDTRGYYNFGPTVGGQLAAASDSQSMSSILSSYYSQAQMAANGVGPSTTVGQWRQGIINKVGAAATQPVLRARG